MKTKTEATYQNRAGRRARASAQRKATPPRQEAAPIYTPGAYVLVRWGSPRDGAQPSQLARVIEGAGGTTIQKWRSRSATWSAAKVIPARDILCAAPAGDPRLTAAKAHEAAS